MVLEFQVLWQAHTFGGVKPVTGVLSPLPIPPLCLFFISSNEIYEKYLTQAESTFSSIESMYKSSYDKYQSLVSLPKWHNPYFVYQFR